MSLSSNQYSSNIEKKVRDLLSAVLPNDVIESSFMPATYQTLKVFEKLSTCLEEKAIPNALAVANDLAEWPFSVAFLFCLHVWPDRFTSEEIVDGFHYFIADAVPHISELLKDTAPPLF